jgi:hypothetical protein
MDSEAVPFLQAPGRTIPLQYMHGVSSLGRRTVLRNSPHEFTLKRKKQKKATPSHYSIQLIIKIKLKKSKPPPSHYPIHIIIIIKIKRKLLAQKAIPKNAPKKTRQQETTSGGCTRTAIAQSKCPVW